MVVPYPVLIAVAVKDDWQLAELFVQAIRIELCLLLADASVPLSPFGFYKSEWFPVVTPQHIIDKPFTLFVWHSDDRKFSVSLLVKRPTSLFQEQVNEIV